MNPLNKHKRNKDKNKEVLLAALQATHGIVKKACELSGLSRNLFYLYYQQDEEFRKQVDLIQEENLDFVEDKLFENIKDKDKASIFFYLKYKGRKRGYEENSNVNITGSLDINLKNLFGFESENEDNTKE